ncbi:MAG TPA: farnesyl diphosphate synthase [Pyrinomonadaceae bacterium]|nr:farnesyl diphosphate synthase [Pyrinomonadaceae bacterium]
MHELKSFFAEVSEKTERTLDDLIPPVTAEPHRLYEAVRWSIFGGGKRFRPALVFAVGRAFGAVDEELLRTAAAVEMVHTYSLIHDDLPAMDDDDLRRGRATCHIKFDEATAILAGDLLQALAFKSISEDAPLSSDVRLKVLGQIANGAARMVAGQQLDLDAEGREIDAQRIEKIHQNKTGALIAASACSGAIIGGAHENEIGAVNNYASKLGLLFQITDDIIDVTQSTDVLGKTAAKDVTANKATYVSIYGLERSRELAKTARKEASAAIDDLDRPLELLHDIADFILERTS